MSDPILKAQQVERALPFINEAFDILGTQLTARMMNTVQTKPGSEAEIKWAILSLNNLNALKTVLHGFLAAGAVEEAQKDYAREIAKLSPERQSLLEMINPWS
jgi:hypothetical protein